MIRQRLRQFFFGLTRVVLWGLLALVLLLLPLLAMLGSEAGSRWLLEQGLGMQRILTAQYQSGTLLGGLELKNVEIKTKKAELYISHALARWSLLSLLRGSLEIESLKVETLALHVVSPPSDKPVHLPLLVLPLRLVVQSLTVNEFQIFPRHATHPFTLSHWQVSGEWWGSRVVLHHAETQHDKIGKISVHGTGRTSGNYPIHVDGTLDLFALHEKGLSPLKIKARNTVADLQLDAVSEGALKASLTGQLQPLLHGAPYSAAATWQPFAFPWLVSQQFITRGGKLRFSGDMYGLRTQGSGQFSGVYLPPATYQWKGLTNWHSAHFDSLIYKGAMGVVEAKGDIDWQQGLVWKIQSTLQQLNLAKQWPKAALAFPVMSGALVSEGKATATNAQMTAQLKLNTGEQWQLQEKATSWPWELNEPQEIKLQWRNVSRQIQSLGVLQSQQGHFSYAGAPQKYRATFEGDIDNAHLPRGQWQANLSGQHKNIQVEHLNYAGEDGALTFKGELDFAQSIQWKGDADISSFHTGWLLPEWPSELTGHISGHGAWQEKQREFYINKSALTGILKNLPFSFDGDVTAIMPVLSPSNWPQIHTSDAAITWADNQAILKGGFLAGKWDLLADLKLNTLAQLNEHLSGSLSGTLSLQGAQYAPDIEANLNAQKGRFDEYIGNTISLKMHLPRLGQQENNEGAIALNAQGVNIKGVAVDDLQLSAQGTRQLHQLQWEAVAGRTRSRGALQGGFDAASLDWQGSVKSGQFSLPELDWSIVQPFEASWKNNQQQMQLAPHCWQSHEARLCNDEQMQIGKTGHLQMHLTGLQAERLATFFPDGLLAKGTISGAVEGSWQAGQVPKLNGRLESENGSLTLGRDTPQAALVSSYQHLGLLVEATPEKIDMMLDLISQELGEGHIEAAIEPTEPSKPLQGKLTLSNLRLDILQPFFPAISVLSGKLSANGQVAGTLKQPIYFGSINIAQGELSLHKLPINLSDIQIAADVQGDTAQIKGGLKSGSGVAALTGNASWRDTPLLNLQLKGQQLELRQQPELLANIDPNLAIQVQPGQVDVTGNIRVPMARINIKTLGSGAVPTSPDVVLVDKDGMIQVQATQSVSQWLINANLDVLLGDDVFFHGYGVNGRLMGGVHLRQQGRRGLEASGEVELDKDARYDAYGQRLQIRRGRLIFAGNLTQPGLDVEAVREVDNEVVGVRVSGRVNTPKVSFFSDDGGLSQEEIVSYLVLGRPLNSVNGENNLSAAAAAIKLGATGGAGLTTKLGETVGITDLALDAEGNGDDTQVTVSGYLSPKLYLRYGVGIFTPINTATIRYKIGSKLYLEAVSSLESAIDLLYTLRF